MSDYFAFAVSVILILLIGWACACAMLWAIYKNLGGNADDE